MKKFSKKMLAFVIAAVMMFAMSVSAMAATITITRDSSYDGSDGRTYNAYKVFDAVYTSLSGTNTQADKEPTYTPADAAVSYTMAKDSPWLTAMQATGQTWFDVKLAGDGSKYVVTPKTGVTESDAADIAAYLKANLPTGATAIPVAIGTATTVDPGYYVILASDGATNVTVVTTDVTIVEKNTYITTTKTTAETSYSVGDIVTYTATVAIPADASLTEPIVLHDEMDTKLAFKEDVAATVDGAEFTGFTTSYDDGAAALADDCTFELTIPVTSAILGKTITFTYTAEVTSAAADPDTGLVNELFGEKNGYKTTPDTPQVYTFDFDFSKEFVGSTDTSLTATFELRTTADDASTAISFIAGTAAGSYIKADSDDTGSSTVITSTNNAAINIQGLKAGTYYLVEKTTSTGYNLLDGPVAVVITDTSTKNDAGAITAISHSVTIGGNASTEAAPAKIQNQSGTVLPSTGGMGTTILYVVGGIVVAAALVLLITKKRMRSQEY